MDNQSKRIRVKALAWIEDQGMLFVVGMTDKVKLDTYYRAVGGSVEFGESSRETVIREVREELNTAVEVTGDPLIIENQFTCDGEAGHEVDFIYPCRFVDAALYERKTYRLVEADGGVWEARWIPIAECLNGSLRLVPEALLEWYRCRS